MLYEIDGRVAAGVQTFGRSGCAEFVAQTRGRTIDVEGVRYESDPNGACTAAFVRFWEELPLPHGTSDVTVRYRGRAGTYRFDHSAAGVRARHVRGADVAPLMSDRWWHIPDDILAVTVYYGTEAAVRDVSDRIDERLRAEGVQSFVRPAGVPIIAAMDGASSRAELAERWSEVAAGGEFSRRLRVYLSSLEPKMLQRIANEESARGECAYVRMIQRHEWMRDAAVRASPRCASG